MKGRKALLLDKKDFIVLANAVHSEKYDYSLLNDTIGKREKVSIKCNLHGIFYQDYDVHIRKKCGCTKCSFDKKVKTQNFNKKLLEKANLKFNNKFIYSEDEKHKISIECPIHGKLKTSLSNHTKSKYGCIHCSNEDKSNIQKLSKEEFINNSIKTHNNYYDYSLVEFVDRFTKVKIICPVHGEFEQTPEIHSKGCGCQKCSKIGWDKT